MVNITHNSYLLEKLSDEKVSLLTPVTAILVLLLLIGIPGNALVVYFFWDKAKRSTTAVFILFLAMFDFCTCFLSIPVDVILLSSFLKLSSRVLCKFVKFWNHFTAIGASLVLVIISIDRYRRICRPLLGQFTTKQARTGCLLCLCISVALSVPSVFAYDVIEVHIAYGPENTMIQGEDCHTANDGDLSSEAVVYRLIIFILFVMGVIQTIAVYSLIGRVIHHRSKEMRQRKNKLRARAGSVAEVDENAWTIFRQQIRYTTNMVVVTGLFILSYLPYFSLALLSVFLQDHHILSFSDFEFVAYEIGLRSFFLHPAMNPVAHAIFHIDYNEFIMKNVRRMLACIFRRDTQEQVPEPDKVTENSEKGELHTV